MTHELKIGREFADAIEAGEKNFELRKNDRGYQKGDSVLFHVIDRDGNELPEHGLLGVEFTITYVLGGWGLRPEFCAFGIRRKE